jgi:hypothetical protein
MKSKTIEELMMFLCTSRFDLELEQARQLDQFFSSEEIEMLREEKEEKYEEIDIVSISDTEEEGEGIEKEQSVIIIDVNTTTHDEHEPADPELPEYSTQLRVSGRKRKTREDDNFEHY